MLSWCMFCIHKLGSPLFTLPTVFFPVFSPSSMGIPPLQTVHILHKTSWHYCLLPTFFSSFLSSIHKDPPFKLSSFKTIIIMYMFVYKTDLILPTLYSSLQTWYSQGFPFNITQTFFFMSNFNWYTVLWFVK